MGKQLPLIANIFRSVIRATMDRVFLEKCLQFLCTKGNIWCLLLGIPHQLRNKQGVELRKLDRRISKMRLLENLR